MSSTRTLFYVKTFPQKHKQPELYIK